jgi:hypothetical protein
LRRLAKQADKQQKYNPKKRFVNAQQRQAQGRLGAGYGLPPVLLDGSPENISCRPLASL